MEIQESAKKPSNIFDAMLPAVQRINKRTDEATGRTKVTSITEPSPRELRLYARNAKRAAAEELDRIQKMEVEHAFDRLIAHDKLQRE